MASASNTSDVQAIVDQCLWFHSIDLGNGIITPGNKSLAVLQTEFASVFNGVEVAGKRVLDIGAWNGAFTAESARRGASHITAVDHVTWGRPGWGGRTSFDLVVREKSIPAVAYDIDIDAPRVSLSYLGMHDVVLFLGVFYHLQDPIATLRELAAITGEVLVLETHIEHTADPRPCMIFYPGSELAGDPTNWWGPNIACVEQLLGMVGFPNISVLPGSDDNRRVFHARRG